MTKGGALIQWQEIRERLRLNKIYEGLRVKDDRPRYIFDGKNREHYRRFHPSKKTKAVFPPLGSVRTKDGILIPGLKTLYRPIIGASPGTYYARQGGTAANKEVATGPGFDASACMSIATHNAETFSAGDDIILADDGGVYRAMMLPPSSGSPGSPITYQPETGDSPVISGADLRTGWADQGSNVWDDALTIEPEKVFFNGTQGTLAANKAAISSSGEWFWGTNILSVYSTSDPDTAFTDPGIEAIARSQCIDVRQSYITIDGIDCTMAKDDNIRFLDGGAQGWTDCIVKNLTTSHGAGQGIWFNINNLLIDNIITANNGVSGLDHGVYASDWNGAFASNYVIQYMIATDNFGAGITMGDAAGGIVRYNNCSGGQWGIHTSSNVADETIDIYYNLLHDTIFTSGNGDGIKVLDENSGVTINIFNNVIYNCGRFGIHGDNNAAAAAIVIKNNIVLESTSEDLYQSVVGTSNYTIDNNCYYRSSGNMIRWGAITYTQAQFSTYQSDSGQDANGISADPLFVDAPNYDFTLQSLSPCINAGEDVGLTQDFVGITVPQGSAPDIGAYEYVYPNRVLIPVRVVDASELKVNGGRFTLRQGPAIKVRGYKLVEAGATKIKGGDVLPVYILADTDIKSGGGRWRVNAGEAIQVTDVIGDARGVIQGHAVPVFPVDDNGDYDSGFS